LFTRELYFLDSPPPSPPDSRNSRQATQQAGIQINAAVPVTSSAEPETSEATRVTGVEIDASPATPPPSPPDSRNSRQATQQAGIQINAAVPVSSSAEPETSEAIRVTGVVIWSTFKMGQNRSS
jgi:hypothetical protein